MRGREREDMFFPYTCYVQDCAEFREEVILHSNTIRKSGLCLIFWSKPSAFLMSLTCGDASL